MSYSQVKLGAIMTHRPDILESLQTSEIQETSEAWLTQSGRRRVSPGWWQLDGGTSVRFQLQWWLLMVATLSVWFGAWLVLAPLAL